MAVVLGMVRTGWQGTSGGPGVTQLAIQARTDPHSWDATTAQQAVDDVRAFWDAIKALLPDEIVLTVSPVVDVYSITSGTLLGSHSAPVPPTNVTGTGAGAYSMASGAKLNLNTGNIIDGRRVRGSIFLVPIIGTATTNTGVIASTARTTISTAGTALQTALNVDNHELVVWSRPTSPGPSTDGEVSIVTGFDTSEKGAILRGRRD